MNVMLQRHCARYIYVVPEGLKELMTDISREVIRNDPENIYTFIADYLDALLITRENARVAARLVQSIAEIATTTVELLVKTGMDRPKADKIVSVIQKSFKKRILVDDEADISKMAEEVEEVNIVSDIIDEADIPPEVGEEAAKIIQNAYRRFKARRDAERELLSGMVDWRAAARSAIYLYRKTGVTYEEANRAATMIKAAYKGYYTRRVMKKLAEESRLFSDTYDEEEEEEEEEDSEHDQKFVTIDYGSIIPHVDFAEPQSGGDEADSKDVTMETQPTTSGIVQSTIEEVLDLMIEVLQRKDHKLSYEEEEEPPEEKVDMKVSQVEDSRQSLGEEEQGQVATESEEQDNVQDQPPTEGEIKEEPTEEPEENKEAPEVEEVAEVLATETPTESAPETAENNE